MISYLEIENSRPIIYTETIDNVTEWDAPQRWSTNIKSSCITRIPDFKVNFWYKNRAAYTSEYGILLYMVTYCLIAHISSFLDFLFRHKCNDIVLHNILSAIIWYA